MTTTTPKEGSVDARARTDDWRCVLPARWFGVHKDTALYLYTDVARYLVAHVHHHNGYRLTTLHVTKPPHGLPGLPDYF